MPLCVCLYNTASHWSSIPNEKSVRTEGVPSVQPDIQCIHSSSLGQAGSSFISHDRGKFKKILIHKTRHTIFSGSTVRKKMRNLDGGIQYINIYIYIYCMWSFKWKCITKLALLYIMVLYPSTRQYFSGNVGRLHAILTVRDSLLRPLVMNVNPCVSMATPVFCMCSSTYLKWNNSPQNLF